MARITWVARWFQFRFPVELDWKRLQKLPLKVGPITTAARIFLSLGLLACGDARSTAELPTQLEARMASEGVLRRAADLTFRYTEAPGRRRARWEDRRASIVITPRTILIHKKSKIGLEITPRTRLDVAVERDGSRVRLRIGRGRAEQLWSFVPPDGDVTGWTKDLRAVTPSMQHHE